MRHLQSSGILLSQRCRRTDTAGRAFCLSATHLLEQCSEEVLTSSSLIVSMPPPPTIRSDRYYILRLFVRPLSVYTLFRIRDERECLFQSHSPPSQRFIPIPIPKFSLVLFPFPSHSRWLFPFPPAPIPIRFDIFCQFTAALLLIVFWVAEIIKVEDTVLLSWWAMTVECVTVRRSSRRS